MAKPKSRTKTGRPYADTTVSVLKSRADIDKVLHKHGVENTQWTTGAGDITMLRFIFEHDGVPYTVRYTVDPRTQGRPYEEWNNRRSSEQHWKREAMVLHRVLYFAVKSNLEVVESGLLDPIAVWLPQIEAGQKTVRERIGAELSALNVETRTLMLGEASS